ncbi:MAG: ABC transporter permease subunit/CPBP intramembrane protease [Candidatus Riflebacteria bacterium]
MPKLNLKNILSIFRKELVFTLRDADLILTIVLLPMIVYPLLAIGGAIFVGQAKSSVEKAEVKVVLPEILQKYEQKLATQTVTLAFAADPQKHLDELKDAKIDALVEIATLSADFAEPQATESLCLQIQYDRTRWRSDKASDLIYDQLADLREELRESRQKARNIGEDFFFPIRIKEKNIAVPSKMGGSMVGDLLPSLIIIFSMLGAFYSAIDLTTGEKERGTLETLLLSPVSFNEIMLGKFLTVVAVVMISVSINLFFLGGTFKFGLYQMSRMMSVKLMVETSWISIILIFFAMIPLAATISAAMMAVSFMARTMKEAQNYLAPIISLLILPSFSGSMPGIDLTPFTASIPIVNLSLLFKAFFVGDWSVGMYLITVAASTVHAIIALALAASLFRSEDLFDRSGGELAHLFYPVAPTCTAPTARGALFIFGIVVGLAFSVGEFLQNNPRWSLITGLALLQLVVILAPPLAYLLFYRYRLVPTLNLELNRLRLGDFLVVPVMSLCVLVWIMQYSLIQNHFFPAPDELNKLFLGFFDVAPVWWVFVVGSLMAGFCEEVLFRGVILKGLQSRLGIVWALVISSCMFGLFHITPYKMVSTGLIGLWLGYLRYRTGSLWLSIYGHAFNNAVALALVYAISKSGAEAASQVSKALFVPLPLLAASIFVFWLLQRHLSTGGQSPVEK